MTFTCQYCQKACKSQAGLEQHMAAKHRDRGVIRSASAQRRDVHVWEWLTPAESAAPDISAMISVADTVYRHYANWAENAVADHRLGPNDAKHRCDNMLDVLRLLRWFKANETAIKAKAERQAA